MGSSQAPRCSGSVLRSLSQRAAQKRRSRDIAWAMSEENVGGILRSAALGLTVRAFARLDHA